MGGGPPGAILAGLSFQRGARVVTNAGSLLGSVIAMRRTVAFAALSFGLAALSLGSSATAANRIAAGHRISWGKPGVSLEDYWTDSAQCGHEAADTDLANTDPGKALVYASRITDNATSAQGMAIATRLVNPEVQWNRAATIIQKELEKCLMERGYVKFRLTDGQAKKLSKFETGSLERRRYLHSLASNPDLLAKQALTDT
jgi:hypothetical protein